jgi:eukaryotic-like serine/threonine-protein kinase
MAASTRRENRPLEPAQIYADFLEKVGRSETTDFAELCGRYPHHAEELRELHGQQGTVEQQPPSSASTIVNVAGATVTPPRPAMRYGLQNRLARGGMGVIYKVWDKVLHRELAMKVVRQQETATEAAAPADPRVLIRFVREAEITAKLDHPGVVPIHDLGVDEGGRIFFTMRLVQGKSLAAVLELAREHRENWTQTRVVDVIVKVCETLAFAHSRGVIHRDLKPDNIMVGAFGETYVMDWGLAKMTRGDDGDLEVGHEPASAGQTVLIGPPEVLPVGSGASGSSAETEMGCVLGTAWYMPPEQASGQINELDERSDIYSVGAILYELLSGRRPYALPSKAAKSDEIIEAVLAGPPAPIALTSPRVPAELAAICEKAMARQKDGRYQNMRDMAEDLRAYLEHRVVRAYQTGAWAELKKWVKRNRGLATASGLTVIVFLGGLLAAIAIQSAANVKLSDANNDILAANAKIVEESRQKQEALKEQTRARRAAEQERRRAEGLYLARQSADVVDTNPGQALLLALESHGRHPGFEANSAMLAALASHHEARTLFGHRGPIHMAALSRDGKRAVTASEDGTAIVWNLASGEPVAWLIGHTNWIRNAEFSPNGQWIITASNDRTAALWDARTGEMLHLLAGHEGWIWSAAFSPDSLAAATASLDGTVRLWDISTHRQRSVLAGHEGSVFQVAFHPDGTRLASGGADKTVCLWNVATGSLQSRLEGHEGGVGITVFTSDGRQLVTAAARPAGFVSNDGRREERPSTDRAARVWDVETGRLVRLLEHSAVVQSVAISRKPGHVATGAADGSVHLWNPQSGQLEHRWQVPEGSIRRLAFSPDDRMVAAATDCGAVQLWDTATGASRGQLLGHSNAATAVAFASPREAVTASLDRTLRVWNIRPHGECLASQAGDPSGATLEVSSDGSRFILAPRRGAPARLVAVDRFENLAELKHNAPLTKVRFSPDGTRIAALSQTGELRLWSAADGSAVATLPGLDKATGFEFSPRRLSITSNSPKSVTCWSISDGKPIGRIEFADDDYIRLCPGGRHVLSKAGNQTDAILWEIESGERIGSLTNVTRSADDQFMANFSPDGSVLATRSTKQPQPRLWNVPHARLIGDLDLDTPGATIAFSPEGHVLATSSPVTFPRTWDATTGKARSQFSGIDSTTSSLAIGPEGHRVIVTSGGHSRLWDGRSGRMMRSMGERDDAVQRASFSRDGKTLLTTNAKLNRVVAWDASTGERISAIHRRQPILAEALVGSRGQWFVTALADGSARIWPVHPLGSAQAQVPRQLTPDERDLFLVGDEEERRAAQKAWRARHLAKFLAVVSKTPVRTHKQRGGVQTAIHTALNEFAESLPADLSPKERAAELLKIEKEVRPQTEPSSLALLAIGDLRWLLEQLAAGEPIRINAGGSDFVAQNGAVWRHDSFFTGGALFGEAFGAANSSTEKIHGTPDEALFQTERWFHRDAPKEQRGYRFPLPRGRYRVILHFAEIYFRPPERRVLSVVAEDKVVIDQYDVLTAGFGVADKRQFEIQVDDGLLNLEFQGTDRDPKVSAIEILNSIHSPKGD